jgi:hypothetical protein
LYAKIDESYRDDDIEENHNKDADSGDSGGDGGGDTMVAYEPPPPSSLSTSSLVTTIEKNQYVSVPVEASVDDSIELDESQDFLNIADSDLIHLFDDALWEIELTEGVR